MGLEGVVMVGGFEALVETRGNGVVEAAVLWVVYCLV